MTQPPDVRLIQLARILGVPVAKLNNQAARAAISERPGDVASAFFAEASDSDDVTSTDSARDYLADRLAFFGDLIPGDAANAIRAAFEECLKAWA